LLLRERDGALADDLVEVFDCLEVIVRERLVDERSLAGSVPLLAR
jgi:hypothetical protein